MGQDYDLICIGSGPAGRRGAIQAAKLGKRVAVVEQGRIVGGVRVETGTIPSKTFREAMMNFLRVRNSGRRRGRGDSCPAAKDLLKHVSDVVSDAPARNRIPGAGKGGVRKSRTPFACAAHASCALLHAAQALQCRADRLGLEIVVQHRVTHLATPSRLLVATEG